MHDEGVAGQRRWRMFAWILAAGGVMSGLGAIVFALASSSSSSHAGGLEFRAFVPMVANDEYHAPVTPTVTVTTTSTNAPTTTPTTPANTLTLEAGRGFIFEPPQVTTSERDVWWNGIQFVPANGVGMKKLGKFESLAEVGEPPRDGYSSLLIEPEPGDAVAFRLRPEAETGYTPFALIWVHPDSPVSSGGHSIRFTWRYYPGEPCGGTEATIIELNKLLAGTYQYVTIQGAGDMTGWKIVSVQPKPYTYHFPDGWMLNGTAEVRSATAQFPPTADALWWSHLPTWNMGADNDAQLYNCEGTLVQTFDDDQ